LLSIRRTISLGLLGFWDWAFGIGLLGLGFRVILDRTVKSQSTLEHLQQTARLGCSRKPMNFLSKQWQALTADWHVLLEKPVSPKKLSFMLIQTSLPSFGFYFMLTLAAMIATLGLLSNSAATIIGAMIVAPLMGPIISAAYALVTADHRLLSRSLLTIITGTLLVVTISAVTAYAIGLRVVGAEILARTNPTLLDLGVAVSAGGAGAFAMTRKSISNAIAGVAIAVALVPPLCVVGVGIGLGSDAATGVGLSLGDRGIVPGSFLLFTTNLVGIIVSAGLVFLLQAYGDVKKAIIGLSAAVLSLIAISYPLGFSLNRLIIRNEIYHGLSDVKAQRPDLFADLNGYSWNVRFDADTVYVDMDLMAPPETFAGDRLSLIAEAIAEGLGIPVKVKFRLIPVNVVEIDVDKTGKPQ